MLTTRTIITQRRLSMNSRRVLTEETGPGLVEMETVKAATECGGAGRSSSPNRIGMTHRPRPTCRRSENRNGLRPEPRMKRSPYDAFLRLFDGQQLRLWFLAQLKLHFALLEGPFAKGETDRNANQVRIAEFLSCAGEAIVEQYVNSGFPELLIQLLRLSIHRGILEIKPNKMRVKGRNGG